MRKTFMSIFVQFVRLSANVLRRAVWRKLKTNAKIFSGHLRLFARLTQIVMRVTSALVWLLGVVGVTPKLGSRRSAQRPTRKFVNRSQIYARTSNGHQPELMFAKVTRIVLKVRCVAVVLLQNASATQILVARAFAPKIVRAGANQSVKILSGHHQGLSSAVATRIVEQMRCVKQLALQAHAHAILTVPTSAQRIAATLACPSQIHAKILSGHHWGLNSALPTRSVVVTRSVKTPALQVCAPAMTSAVEIVKRHVKRKKINVKTLCGHQRGQCSALATRNVVLMRSVLVALPAVALAMKRQVTVVSAQLIVVPHASRLTVASRTQT